jgi:hypothetical protein
MKKSQEQLTRINSPNGLARNFRRNIVSLKHENFTKHRYQLGCKSRLLFAMITMAIWFQVSGVRCQKACSVTTFYKPQNPPRPYIVFVKIIWGSYSVVLKRLWRRYLTDPGCRILYAG